MAHLGKIPKLANLEASYRQSDTKRSHRLLQSSAVLNLSVFKEARHSKDFATAPKSTRYCKKRRNTRGEEVQRGRWWWGSFWVPTTYDMHLRASK